MDKNTKLILLFLLLINLIVGMFVIAQEMLDFNYKESYNDTTETIIIKNSTGDVAEIQLTTPQNNFVIAGKDRRVACLEINNSIDNYKEIFEKIETYDNKNNLKPITKIINYKLANVIGQREIYSQNKTCTTKGLNINGTADTICTTNFTIIGYEDIIEYTPFNNSEGFEKNTKEICLFTDVESGESIEWIPTMFGNRLTEFASWIESFNDGLIGIYLMDERSGTTINNTVVTLPNGTITIGTYQTYSKFGPSALNFSSTGYVTIADHQDLDKNLSISFWLNPYATQSISDFIIARYSSGGGGDQWEISYSNPTSKLFFYTNKGEFTSSGSINFNVWNHIVFTMNDTSCAGWLNGVIQGNVAGNCSIVSGEPLTINDVLISGGPGQGGYDDLYIWNRTLTQSEITSLYDSGTGTKYTQTTTPPDINITAPFNNTRYINNTIVVVNYTVSDLSLHSCWWTNNSGTLNTSLTCGVNITGQVWREGDSLVIVWANDTNGLQNSSAVNFSIDTLRPIINITEPSGAKTSQTITSNFSADDLNLQTCWYNVSRGASSEITNTIVVCSSGSPNITTFTVSADGSYMFWASGNDSFGNMNYTNMSFSVSTSSGDSGSGGGGGAGMIASVIKEEMKIDYCANKRPPFELAWKTFIENRTTDNFWLMLKSFLGFTSCRGASTIVPLRV